MNTERCVFCKQVEYNGPCVCQGAVIHRKRLEDERHAPPESAGASRPVEAQTPEQKENDIANLRFYADLFRDKGGEIGKLLSKALDRLAVPAAPADSAPCQITEGSGCVFCDIGMKPNEYGNHIINRRSQGRGDEAIPCPLSLPPADTPARGGRGGTVLDFEGEIEFLNNLDNRTGIFAPADTPATCPHGISLEYICPKCAAPDSPVIPDSSRPPFPAPWPDVLNQIHWLATRALAEPGGDTATLTAICTLLESDVPAVADTSAAVAKIHNPEIFVAEYEDGSLVDNTGDGGWSAWFTRAEAQDAADNDTDNPSTVVRYVRADTPEQARLRRLADAELDAGFVSVGGLVTDFKPLFESDAAAQQLDTREREWRVAWEWADSGFTASPGTVGTEAKCDQEVAGHKRRQIGNQTSNQRNIRKEWRYKAGPWNEVKSVVDADTPSDKERA